MKSLAKEGGFLSNIMTLPPVIKVIGTERKSYWERMLSNRKILYLEIMKEQEE